MNEWKCSRLIFSKLSYLYSVLEEEGTIYFFYDPLDSSVWIDEAIIDYQSVSSTNDPRKR